MNILEMIKKDPGVSKEFKETLGPDGKNEKIASDVEEISCELERIAKEITLIRERLEKVEEKLRQKEE